MSPVSAPFFYYRDAHLYCEELPLSQLAGLYGTPLYVYSRAALAHAWQAWSDAMDNRHMMVCYGMKACSNLAILQLFAKWGAGFDIVSGGELSRALMVGADPQKIVFSGVGKKVWEIEAALKAGIHAFNVESLGELHRIAEVATRLSVRAPISLRVNPDVDAKTHPYISTGLKENKFGIDIALVPEACQMIRNMPSLELRGLDCHIGSQITDISPYLDALEKLCNLIDQLGREGIQIRDLDLGGGVGITYQNEQTISLKEFVKTIFEYLKQRGLGHLFVVMEPGRSLVGNSAVLLTEVQYLKPTQALHFAVVDAAMNDLLRPTLYEAYHQVLPVHCHQKVPAQQYDIVGPICESGDWLAKNRSLAIVEGDLLAIESVGAYGFAMSSHYNTRVKPAEVLVNGSSVTVIRPREKLEDLFSKEVLLSE